MIYTIGDPTVYDPLFASGPFRKLGPYRRRGEGPYPGGIAFPTVNEARAFLRRKILYKNYAVYSLRGCYRRDTYRLNGQHHINKNLYVLEKIS